MRPPESWSRARVTLAITAITAAAWVLLALFRLDGWATIWGGFIPARFGLDDPRLAPVWLTPLTATLIHANILHLAFNLIFLAFCGRPTETVLGPVSFGLLYVVGAYAAALGQYLMDLASPVPMVGASGAISAVLGAYAILFGRNKVKIANPTLALLVNALWLMAAWVGMQVLVGLAFGSAGLQIAIAAHIGGFLAGVALANPLLLLRYRRA